MSIIQKTITNNFNDTIEYLTNLGFTISNNKILWSYAELDTTCFWKIDNETIYFQRSDGENAFKTNLVDFSVADRSKCAIISIQLQDNGIALYMGMIPDSMSPSEATISMSNNDFSTEYQTNGLVVLSSSEDDNHWYYGWNNKTGNDNILYWCLDNGHGNYEYTYDETPTQLSCRRLNKIPNSISIVQIYLNTGHWSKNIFSEVLGEPTPPCSIFKLQGQKYISFSTNSNYRCPVYKLAADPIEQNLSTSTDPYSSLRTYVVGDYCTFNGYVYRCTTAIQTPEPFDDSKWVQTTVPNELLTAGDHIYGA